MKLNDIDFVKLLPQFMRNDAAVSGLAAGVNQIVRDLAESVEMLSSWDHIDQLDDAELDELDDAELDELAWELNIQWYDTGATLEVKRDLVKNSDRVFQRLGTKWAVENIITAYFGEGYVEEWFEYGGEPGHFRVLSPNPSLNEERITEFLSLLSKVKRASAKLDGVIITLSGQVNMTAGVAYHETGHDTFVIE